MANTRTRATHVIAALLSLLLISFMVLRVSSAAFTATTDNTGNAWSSGSVILEDDDSGTAMFNVTNMKPGQTETRCIKVTYKGSLDASVKLYGAITGGTGLGTYLNVTIDRGTGGSFGNCSGYAQVEALYTGTLAGFPTAHSSFGTGAGTWAPVGGGPDDDMTYRVQVTLQDNNAAQAKTATASFTWEAQNT